MSYFFLVVGCAASTGGGGGGLTASVPTRPASGCAVFGVVGGVTGRSGSLAVAGRVGGAGKRSITLFRCEGAREQAENCPDVHLHTLHALVNVGDGCGLLRGDDTCFCHNSSFG